MPKHLLAVSIAAVLCHVNAHGAGKTVPAEAEFKRALSIIEQTQLTIFTDTTPASRQEIVTDLNDRLSTLDNTQTDAASNSETDADSEKLELIRDVLTETIDQYNDQYANYIPPDALRKYNEKRTGSYHGVGLKFRVRTDDYPVVIGPLIGGPLEHSNLQPADQIIRARDTDLKGLASQEVVKLLKGPQDTTVELTIERDGTQHKVLATRGPVDLRYSSVRTIDNIGVIKISRFGGNTHKHVRTQLKDQLDQQVQGIVLDLRDNPGGSTRAARAVVSMFSKEEHVYCERYKSGTARKLPRHGEHMTDLPLVVLVNGQSMSSSEIVAGALQSHGRATIIGAPTFGKGLVQKVFNLSAPLGGAIRTTIAAFGTPDGQLIQAGGVVPDKYIQTDADFMYRRTGSLNIRTDARQYQRLLLEQRVKVDYPDKAQYYIDAADAQLEAALELLQKGSAAHQASNPIATQTN